MKRVLIFFAPAFIPLGTALMKELSARDSAVQFIGVASTRQVRDTLMGMRDISFAALECLEENEERWIKKPFFDAVKMKAFEDRYGAKTLHDIIVADRQAGAEFVTCAEREESVLARACRDPDVLNSYTLGVLDYTDYLFETYKPTAVFCYVVASAPTLCLAKACIERGVFFARLQHTRIEDFTVLDTDFKGMMAPIWKRFQAGEKPAADKAAQGKIWLENFRHKNSEPDYMALLKTQSRKTLSASGIAKSIARAAARGLFYGFVKPNKPLRAPSGWQGFRQSITTPVKTRALYQRKGFKTIEDLKSSHYIYYPLHVDPEASTMVLAPDYTNQLAVIRAASKALPPGMQLFVKEHPNMAGRRPKGFYDEIAALPCTALIHPSITGRDALNLCAGVFTITGTSGWEAVLIGKPCVVLGDGHFQNFESITHCPDIADLPQALQNSFQKKPLSDDELIRFLGITFEESFPVPSKLAWASEGK
ncbi:MAG TPA: hypothetical protein PLO23_00660, partial [Alphaproteobacteria bacterium]|nr:hypothetical protein [Alphaproteobacteria bacterium]